MSEPARHLRVVDTETGEVHEGCPNCSDLTAKLEEAHRKLDGAWLENRSLKKDYEREHIEHDDRPRVEALHAFWQAECSRPRSALDFGKSSRFEAWLRGLKLGKRMAKKLKLDLSPDEMCRLAVMGAGFDPYTNQLRNGAVERYDDPTTIFKNLASFERFVNRAPREARERLLRPKEGES